jgi:predicted porin
MYQFGNDVDTDHGRGYAGQIGYENSLFGIQTAYNNFTDTVKVDASSSTQLKAGLYNTEAWILAAKLTPSKEVKFSGGYQWMQLRQPDDLSLAYGSVFGYSITDVTFGNNFASTNSNSSKSIGSGGGDHQNIDFWWVGGEYDFAERFPQLAGLTLSGAYYRTNYGTLDGLSPTGLSGATGKDFHINTETAILDYKLNKRFDLYAAATWNQFGGTYVDVTSASIMANKDINAYGVGVRMKF